MLAATALSAVLMVSVLQITEAIHRSGRAMETARQNLWADDFADVLREDLATVPLEQHTLVVNDTGYAFTCLTAYRTATSTLHTVPVEIRYEVDKEHGILLRIERDLTAVNPTPEPRILAVGVESFDLEPINSDSVPPAEAAGDEAQSSDDGSAQPPISYRWRIGTRDGQAFEGSVMFP